MHCLQPDLSNCKPSLISRLILLLLLATQIETRAQTPALTPLSARLDSLLRTLPSNQPGIALQIAKNGFIIYQNYTGLADNSTPIDSTTNFRMASVSKQFTGLSILLLEKNHSLTLDDPIGHWLPELPKNIGNNVLIRHLLTHSSGILDYESLIPDTTTTQVLDKEVLNLLTLHDSTYFPPGTRFRYSNSGFCLLALIIERASHQTFAEYVKENIFKPLRMDHSTIYEKDQPIYHRAMGFAKDNTGKIIPSDQSVTSATKGDGGVYTSLTDYAKWIRALQQNRLINLPATLNRLRFPITPETMPHPTAEPTAKAAPAPAPTPTFYAAGWFISTSSPPILFHSGSTCGFSTYVIQIPGDEWSITYFSNLAENTTPFRQITKLLEANGMTGLTAAIGLQDLTR